MRRCGVEQAQVYRQLAHIVNANQARNVMQGRRGRAMYVWIRDEPRIAVAPRISPMMDRGAYMGEDLKRAPARAGALDFLGCDSLRGSERVPHRLPISIAGSL